MRAAYVKENGPAEAIQLGDLPQPEPRGSQVLVRVSASSVNPVDTYLRAGLLPWELPRPYIPGCDLAGVVEETGPQARRFRRGDRVWGSNQGLLGRQGTSAELAAVDETWLYPSPPDVRDEELAAMALVGITAHLALFREARLQPGETVFVNGGSGGVGSAAIQLATLTGARVITTAGSPAKGEKCRSFGADEVILYQQQAVAERVRALCPEGVGVWIETLREPDFLGAIPLLRPRGRMVTLAGRDATPPFPLGPFYTRDCKLLGFAMFNASAEEQRICAEDLNRWLSGGALRANIDRTFPLASLAEAHRLQEASTLEGAGTLAGKIVITI